MFTQAFLLASALLCPSFHTPPDVQPDASVFAPEGGPPRISLADKAGGDITKAEWAAIKTVELQSCVPDARITALTICIKDCANKAAFASGTDGTITSAMRSMIANLPAGTSFTVKVAVKDAKGKAWAVPDAAYTWRN